MKIIGLVFLLVSVANCNEISEEASDDCKTWPSNLPSLQECCSIPYHSNMMLQNICQNKCMIKPKDSQSACALDCYINITGLLRDGKINKVVVKRIYDNNAYNERQWSQIISDGVDKTEYDGKSGSLAENLVKFYNSVEDYLGEHCVSFIQSNDCYLTEEHFEKCKNTQPNCTAWPMNMMNPEVCCKTPILISEKLSNKCHFECQRKELFMPRQVECIQNCTYIETGLRVDGKFNFETVKKVLIENSNHSEAWEKPITETVETCEKTIKGTLLFFYYLDSNLLFFVIRTRGSKNQ